MSQRTLFTPADVFISWNNRDRELKNKLVAILRNGGYTVWESDYECNGSIKEVCLGHITLCKVFVILLTPNSLKSGWVRDELETAMVMEEGSNRIVPVIMDRTIIEQQNYGTMERALTDLFANRDNARDVSAVVADGMTDADLQKKLLKNVGDLCKNRSFRLYRENLQRVHLRIPVLVNVDRMSAGGNWDQLYIPRRLRYADPSRQEEKITEQEFLYGSGCSIILGNGGSGKSQYLQNMAATACRETEQLVFLLPCAEISRSRETLADHLFRQFREITGDTTYSRAHFDALLSRKRDSLLLLLDGMDEVIRNADHENLRKTVQQFLNIYPNARAIFTTRNQIDADRMILSGKAPEQYWLERFSEDDIRSFAQRLFIAFDDESGGERFYMDLASIDAEIKGNPLLVSQLAVIYADSGKLPGTVVEIFDVITELLTTGIDSRHDLHLELTEEDQKLVQQIPMVLRELAYRKYRKAADEEIADNVGLVGDILERQLGEPPAQCRIKATRVLHYLDRRAILYRNEFAHKMFQEYFTAVYLYESCFTGAGEIRNRQELQNYFRSFYSQRYWETVTVLLLSKADHLCAASGLEILYAEACAACGGNYDLMMQALPVQRRKDRIACFLLGHILEQTLKCAYDPYGQWFCYVPRENLYRAAADTVAAKWSGLTAAQRPVALSLLRDVCYIFGGYTQLEQVTDRKNLRNFQLFCCRLSPSPRAALNTLFCGAKPGWLDDYLAQQAGSGVYPWFFNVHAVAIGNGQGFGAYALNEIFRDELGLYGESQPWEDGCYWGLVSLPHDPQLLEAELTAEYAAHMTGLALLPGETEVMDPLPIANTQLELLVLPGSVKRIGRYSLAYYGLAAKNPLRIQMAYGPEQLEKENGLKYAGTVAHLHLPDSVLALPDGVFDECVELLSIHLPAHITEIGAETFAGCEGLRGIVIPDSVVSIGSSAFDGCTALTQVILPDGLSHLGSFAFTFCSALREIELPASLTQVSTGTFQFCSALVSVRIPEGVKKLENTAFIECTALERISLPGSLETIESECFRSCPALRSVVFPDALEEIGSCAFQMCAALEEVRFGNRLQRIGASAFHDCPRLNQVILPDSVTQIGMHAFSDCTGMTRLRLPADLSYIDIGTFSHCTGLTSLEIPGGIRSIWANAFSDCTGIAQLTLGEGLKTIDETAFAGCTALGSVRIPDSVEEIGNAAFIGCEALASIHVPAHTKVGMSAFENCPGDPGNRAPLDDYLTLLFGSREAVQHYMAIRNTVAEVAIDGSHCPDGVLDHHIVTSLVPKMQPCRLHIGPGIHRIREKAFVQEDGWTRQQKITHITLDAGVKQIEPGAFAACKYLESITLPPTMSELPDLLFKECAALSSIQLPEGLTRIGNQTFFCCMKLQQLVLPESLTFLGQDAFRGTGLEQIRIPDGITELPKGIFAACDSLRSVRLPDTLIRIGDEAFSGCIHLSHVALPAGLLEIGKFAFFNCTDLPEVLLPPTLEALAFSAFQGCTSLETLYLPPTLRQIPENAFSGCPQLKSLRIPETVTSIGANAFCRCHGLTEITVSGSVAYLDCVFYECNALRSVHLESGVRVIGENAFTHCVALEQITIPNTVTIIEAYAFGQCRSLTHMQLSQNLEQIGQKAFVNCASLREIRIPDRTFFISPDAFKGCTNLRRASLPVRFRDKVSVLFGAYQSITEESPNRILVEL